MDRPSEPQVMNNNKNNNNETAIDMNGFSNRHVSLAEDRPKGSEEPLLLQPSYRRSKSVIHDELRKFRMSLKWCALDHSSCGGKVVSYVALVLLAVVVPLLTSVCVRVPPSSHQDDPIAFNKLVQIPESALALISFFTLSSFFRRYGLRQLLFLDVLEEDTGYVRRGYSRELEKAFRVLAYIILPSLLVELAHKVTFFSTVKIVAPYVNPTFPLNSVVFLLVLLSWLYRAVVFLVVCVLFRLTCELQILRFQGVHMLFEGCGSDAGLIFKEHLRIRRQLCVTSHRYRFFIIGCLVTISVSHLGSLLLVLASKYDKTFFNSGDLLICSVVQLSGFFLCLLGAARITHRAQGIVSIATRWHMLVTNATVESDHCKTHIIADDGLAASCASDSDSSDIHISVIPQLSSFQTRQSLVTYLQHNNKGITLYGFALDRGLLHTLFAFEFSIVLWILSKVVVLS